MALTPEQEKNNRKAAQLRKKRGRGGNGKKDETQIKPLTLAELTKKNAAYRQYKERERLDLQRTVTGYMEVLREKGAIVVPDTLKQYNNIVNGLKREVRGTDIRWQFTDAGIAFAIQKTPTTK